MIRTQPLLAVRDVCASARWYRRLLHGNPGEPSDHDDIYDRVYVGESLVLQLHAWDKEDHPNLINRDAAPVGHGVLVWFEVDDFTAVVARATQLRADVLLAPFVNENAQHNEIWLRDPDGYVVVLASVGRP